MNQTGEGSTAMNWIAADWGTSNLRAWLMSADDTVLEERRSSAGMGGLAPEAFEPALLDCIGDCLPDDTVTDVVICGMAGARQGWKEAPYRSVPCSPGTGDPMPVETQSPRMSAWIVPGLSQADPADVMRGEETQIAGLLMQRPDFDGVACLPGTHCKWVRVGKSKVTAFVTAMTGEIHALLRNHSVLRHSLGGEGWDEPAFLAALEASFADPAMVSAALFSLRAEALLSGLAPDTAAARLSGYLIGMELAAMQAFWRGAPVVLIGEPRICNIYRSALAALGGACELADATEMTIAGLRAAHRAIRR